MVPPLEEEQEEQEDKLNAPLNQLGSIMLLPDLPVLPQVPRKRLLAPGAARRIADGRHGADAAILAGVLQEQRQGAVAPHAVAREGGPAEIQHAAKLPLQRLRQLLRDVRLHAVVGVPGRARRVHVEPGPRPEVPPVGLARDAGPARRRVRVHHRDVLPRRRRVEEPLLRAVVRRAGQARQVGQDGDFLGRGRDCCRW